MIFHPTSISYSIELDKDTFAKYLLNEDYENTLFSKLLDYVKHIESVDYDGHFGPYVFVEINLSSNLPKTLEEVKKVIEEHCND